MDRLEAMSILLTVVDAGSLSAAARRLNAPLPTISRKITALEDHLRLRLFIRANRSVKLTAPGEAYVAACRRILDNVAEAERAASGEYSQPKGEIVMTAPLVFGRLRLMPIVEDFLKTYTQIRVRVVLTDRSINLIEDHVDLAVRIGPLPDSELVAVRLGEVRRIVCASPEYFHLRGKPERPDELAAHDVVTFEGLGMERDWRGHREISVKPRLAVNSVEAARDAAIAGIGITRLLSYQAAETLASGKLEIALAAFEPDAWPVHLMHVPQRPLAQKVRAFLDWATPRLKAGLA